MDKDAEAVLGMSALLATLVDRHRDAAPGQLATKLPRLWRLMEDRGLRNRMGFNNAGADAAAE